MRVSRYSARIIVCAGLAANLLPMGAGSASSPPPSGPNATSASVEGHLRIPHRLRPGHRIRIRASRFPADSSVRVQFGLDLEPPANCCVTNLSPPLTRPGINLGGDGRRTFKVRMPRRYARCTSVSCDDPDLAAFHHGDRVYVFVATDTFGEDGPGAASARASARVP